jgi:hypothetical protein
LETDSITHIVTNFDAAPVIIGGEKSLERVLAYQDSTERNKYWGKVYLGFWFTSTGQKECITILKVIN